MDTKINKIIYITVLITCSSKKEAIAIKDRLLKNRLVACVNIVRNIQSFFWWNNKIDTSNELLLIAKTHSGRFNKIVSLVKKTHSYDVPEIIALPIVKGNNEYLEWIYKSVKVFKKVCK